MRGIGTTNEYRGFLRVPYSVAVVLFICLFAHFTYVVCACVCVCMRTCLYTRVYHSVGVEVREQLPESGFSYLLLGSGDLRLSSLRAIACIC